MFKSLLEAALMLGLIVIAWLVMLGGGLALVVWAAGKP